MRNRIIILLISIIILGLVLDQTFLIIIASSMILVIGIAWWWREKSIVGLTYNRKFHFTRGFQGEKIKLLVEIENHKLLPLSWVRVQDDWDRSIGPENEEILAPSHIRQRGFLTNVFNLRWFERTSRLFELLLRKRGIYAVGPAKVDTGDLFGIFDKSMTINKQEYITVFPALLPFTSLDFPADDPFGDRRSLKKIFEDPNRPMGTREYHPEDSFRRIHWPATARTGQLQVKLFQPTTGQIMMICMNVSTFTRHWEGINPDLLEHMIKVAATLADEGIKEGYKVGLIANGCLAHADQSFRIPPGRSPQQLAYLLQALAGVTSVVTSNFDRFLLREVPRIQYGVTLVILTSVVSDDLSSTILQLKNHGRRITLYSLALEDLPEIPGIRTIHRPYKASDFL